jgi:hypothetical protein
MQVIDTDQGLGSFSSQFKSGLDNLIHGTVKKISDRQEHLKIKKALMGMNYTPQEAELLAQMRGKDLMQGMRFLPPTGGGQAQQTQPQDPMARVQQVLMGQGRPTDANQSMMQPFQVPPEELQRQELNPYQSLQKALSGGIAPEYDQNDIQGSYNQQQQPAAPAPQAQAQQAGAPVSQRRWGETPQMQLAREKETGIQKRNEAIRDERAYLANKKQSEEISKAYQAAMNNNMRLGRLKTLNDKDKLINPATHSFLKATHLDYPWLMGTDTQEFEEVGNSFLRDARSIFGARITNFELGSFLRLLPTLQNTKEGRSVIIRNMKLYNEAAKSIFNARNDVIKENGGKIPLDMNERIDLKIGPKLENISHRFETGEDIESKKSFSKPPPASDYVNKRIKHEATGKYLRSNGIQWVPE